METHLSDLTVSLRRRRRGNERKARISEIPGAGKGLTAANYGSAGLARRAQMAPSFLPRLVRRYDRGE